MRWVVIVLLVIAPGLVWAQGNASGSNTDTAVCTFQNGKQVSVRYEAESLSKHKELPLGELWPESGSPMLLFTQAELSVGSTEIPVGAYSMYVIPEKNAWTLVINKGVAAGSAYDQQQDVVRVPMQLGQLSQPQQEVEVAFAHMAPKQCNLRIYYGKTGAFAEFKEK